MRLYHGTNTDFMAIDLNQSQRGKDFWATFILANRKNKSAVNIHDYDVVYGPIANDKVGAQIRNVIEQNINMDTFLERLKYMKGITFQYFFGSEKAIQMLSRL